MSRFRKAILILFLLTCPDLEAKGFSANEVPDLELSAFYTSFYSNVGGLPQIGARFRLSFLEFEVMTLAQTFALEVAYTKKLPISRWFVPRFILGAAYAFGGIALVPAVSLTFPLIPIGHTYLGLSLDNYAYFVYTGRKFAFIPVIPLCLTFIF